MLLLSTEASFKPGGPFFGEFTSEHLSQGFIPGRPSLAYEGSGDSVFRTELPVGIIGNDIPSICMLLTFAPNSTDFVSFPLTIGRT